MFLIIADRYVFKGKPIDLVNACRITDSIIRFGLQEKSRLAKANVTVYPQGKAAFMIPASCSYMGAEISLDSISKRIQGTTGYFVVDYVSVNRTGAENRCKRRFDYMA